MSMTAGNMPRQHTLHTSRVELVLTNHIHPINSGGITQGREFLSHDMLTVKITVKVSKGESVVVVLR